MSKGIFFSVFAAAFSLAASGQFKFYEDAYNGGVTAGGWSPTYSGAGTGNFVTNVTAGSTIRRAYLIAGRLGNAPNATVTLNGFNYTFSPANQVTGPFTTIYGGPSGVHVIDVTADINPVVNAYSLTVPVQPSTSNRYQDFKLVVFYDNPAKSTVYTALFLNTFNLNVASNTWTLNFAVPIDNSAPVALSFFNSYQCNMFPDCENITVNGNFLGATGLNDINSGFCGGTLGNFWYENNTMGALSDDNINQGVNQGDALSNSQAIIPNGSTIVTVLFQHCGGGSDNHQWTVTAAYSGGVILPLELLAFDAKALNGQEVKVKWTVASEQGVQHYITERSFDGLSWEKVNETRAMNQGGKKMSYTFDDRNSHTGFSYYRLAVMDESGKREDLSQVAVNREDISKHVNIFPNPFYDILNVEGLPEDFHLITLYNAQGARVVETAFREISMYHLPKGIYLLQVTAADGKLVHQQKVVKQ